MKSAQKTSPVPLTDDLLPVQFETSVEEPSLSESIRQKFHLFLSEEDKFLSLFELIPVGALIVDDNLTIIRCNQAFSRFIGYPPEELLGKRTIDYTHPDDLAACNLKLHALQRKVTDTIRFRKRYLHKDGKVIWGEVSLRLVNSSADTPFYLALIQDITDQKRHEDILQARIRLMQFASSHTLEELLQMSLDEVCLLTGSTIGFYHFLEEDQRTLSLQTWSTRTLREFCSAEGKGRHYPIDQAGIWVDCVHQRKPVVHNDYSAEPHRKGLPPGHAQVLRELVTPVFRGEKIVAILGVGNKPLPYTEEDIGVVSLLADLAWDIAEQKRSEEQIRALYAGLEQRVQTRTQQLENANKEMEAFVYSVSHDLRAPLRAVNNFGEILMEEGELDETGKKYLLRILYNGHRMSELIDDLLRLSRINRTEIHLNPINLSALALKVLNVILETLPQRQVEFMIAPNLTAIADYGLIQIVLENLFSNAFKFTAARPVSRVEFGALEQDGQPVYFVRDNGAGFDMKYASKLFGVFQRLHDVKEYPGTGIGLATVQRIIHRHGGRIWAESQVDQGATFYFTLPGDPLNEFKP